MVKLVVLSCGTQLNTFFFFFHLAKTIGNTNFFSNRYQYSSEISQIGIPHFSLEGVLNKLFNASPKVAGLVLCSALALEAVLIVVANLLTIVLFAVNRNLRKKNLFLIVNMAFADLMLGTVSLPMYTYLVGEEFKLWL